MLGGCHILKRLMGSLSLYIYQWVTVTVGHNPPVSGVAAFGSQDLGFKTSIFGSQDLGFRTSLACVSPPPQPAAPKCNRGRFCHGKCRDRFCHRKCDCPSLEQALWQNPKMSSTPPALQPTYLPFVLTGPPPVLPQKMQHPSSAGELKCRIVVSDRRTHGLREFIYKIHEILGDLLLRVSWQVKNLLD